MTASTHSFVGRVDQRRTIAEYLASDGHGARVVYIDGPAGIGKSSLTDAVADDWRRAGGQIRSSRCWNGPGTPPLWPWIQIVRSEESPDSQVTNEVATTSTDGRSAELARFEQFTSVVTHLVGAARETPLLIVIDDLHWADVATIELLDFVMRDTRASEIRIVVTARTPEAELLAHIPLLAEIANHSERITLTGLQVADVVELAGRFGAPDHIAQSVFDRTGGNPLYVTELLRLGQANVDMDDGEALPFSIGAVIRRHLELLGDRVQRVLQLAAVQGQVFDVEVVAVAHQLDRDELESMLEDARRYQLIQRRSGSWMFVHALVGDALLDDVGLDQRLADHLATADALEKIHGPDRSDLAGTISSHLQRAGRACPSDRLIDATVAAARHAAGQLAWSSQAEFLALALETSRSAGRTDHQLAELMIEKCQAEKSARLIESASSTAAELARLVRGLDDPVLLARAALVYPPDSEGIEIDEIQDPDQVRLRTEALDTLPQNEVALRIQLRASLALSLYWETTSGDRAESHQRSAARRDELTRTALAEARELGDPAVLAVALDARIHATWGPETVGERPQLAEELYEVSSMLGDARRVLAARVWRVVELLETGQLDDADREITAFEADAARISDRIGVWTALRWRSNRAFMAGDLDAAEAIAGEALGLAVEILSGEISMSFYVTMLGPIHYVQGTLGDDLEAVSTIAAESPEVPAWQVGIATAMSETGDLEGAHRRLLRLAADDFAILPRDLNFFGAMIMLSLTSLNVGDAEVAAAVRTHLEPRAGRYAVHGTGYTSYGPVDLALAQCAHTCGDVEAARDHYEVAIAAGDRVGTPYADAARMHLGWLLVTRDPTRAKQVLEEAVEHFEQRGHAVMAARSAALLFEIEAARTVSIREQDGGWVVQPHGAEPLDVGLLKGMRALRELLLQPNTAQHALTLTRIIERDTSEGVEVNDQAFDRTDGRALQEYRARMNQLTEALETADRRGDVARSETLQHELDALIEHVAESEGFGGRVARDPVAADRARVNITKHLKRTVERISALDGALGAHLRATVSTGMYCVYEPGPDAEYRWTI